MSTIDKPKLPATAQWGDSWGGLLEEVRDGACHDVDEAFTRFTEVSEKQLLRYLHRICDWDTDKALDSLQETYLAIWQGISTYDRSKSEEAWVYKIAKRSAGRILRSENKQSKRQVSPQQLTGLDGDDTTYRPTFPDPSAEDPSDAILKDENVEMLKAAIDKLPTKRREVILLRRFSFCSVQATAELLDIPMGTVGSCEKLAKQELREILKHILHDRSNNIVGPQ